MKKLKTKLMILSLIVMAVLALGAYAFMLFSNTSSQMKVVKGPVTEKPLAPEDGPSYLTVDGVSIKTSESGLKKVSERTENFTVDTFSIKKNDIIEVHYLKTGNNEGTLNCKGCYIKKGNDIFKPTRNGITL